MIPAMDVVRRAHVLGIELHVDDGQLRFKAPGGLPDDLKGELRQHKTDIINLLATAKPSETGTAARPAIPVWCRTDCPGMEVIDLPGEGPTAGCVPPLSGSWRRLNELAECPAMEKLPARPLPSWCNARCDHFHKLLVPLLGTMLWCCWEQEANNWRRFRIDAMNVCPIEANLQ